METSVSIVFPHQLFSQHPALSTGRTIYLVEEEIFFRQFNFHKAKLVLHRASMKYYESYLQNQGYRVDYIDCTRTESAISKLVSTLSNQGVQELHFCDVVDSGLEKGIDEALESFSMHKKVYTTPYFLNTLAHGAGFFDGRKTYFQTDFYTWQRKKQHILMEADGKPMGGKWTFDGDNRQKFPAKETRPALPAYAPNAYVDEARRYTEKNFGSNYGSCGPLFEEQEAVGASTAKEQSGFYPVTHEEASRALHEFLELRFEKFGIYEDAMVGGAPVLFHSLLSPMLNTGLLTPRQVLDEALTYASQYEIPLNSLEGFIRQLMGWREFIRIVYEREGSNQRSRNYWGFTRKIPESFWTGTTGIGPVDKVIKSTLSSGYAHHIERLMVMGNFFLLCEFDPDDVHKWFMEMYVDAYDWVMVPNVYGMTQFADGGLMTTKPYISGSNYLLKMGDWQKGPWQEIWDGLFWRFMHVHRDFFLKNPRLGMLVHTFDKMAVSKQDMHLKNAETFLSTLNSI